MEFDPADLQQDPQADPPHPYADLAQRTGRWFLLPLLAIIAATALVAGSCSRCWRSSPPPRWSLVPAPAAGDHRRHRAGRGLRRAHPKERLMGSYPNTPTDDALVITPGGPLDPHDPDGVQVFAPQHLGTVQTPLPSKDRGTLQIGSAYCKGCGERNTEIMIVGQNGKALYVKLRPSMAIKLGELLLIHAKTGSVSQ